MGGGQWLELSLKSLAQARADVSTPGTGPDRPSYAFDRSPENAVTGDPNRWFDPNAWDPARAMELWQMDIVGGVRLADGSEAKIVSGIDDHSRFCVIAEVVGRWFRGRLEGEESLPDLVVVDGGRGQLGSALGLGCGLATSGETPVTALAKPPAQTMEIRLRDETSRTPIVGAIVRLLDQRGPVAQGLSNEFGALVLRGQPLEIGGELDRDLPGRLVHLGPLLWARREHRGSSEGRRRHPADHHDGKERGAQEQSDPHLRKVRRGQSASCGLGLAPSGADLSLARSRCYAVSE